jgi:hypothetical protein
MRLQVLQFSLNPFNNIPIPTFLGYKSFDISIRNRSVGRFCAWKGVSDAGYDLIIREKIIFLVLHVHGIDMNMFSN